MTKQHSAEGLVVEEFAHEGSAIVPSATEQHLKASAGGSVRRALEDLNDRTNRLQPLTQEEMAELGEVALWRIVLEPYIPKKRGLIERPPDVDNAERVISKVGRVLQVGEHCYHSKTASGLDLSTTKRRAVVGDYWLHEMYAGQEVHLRSGHILRLLTETELLFWVKNPDLIKGYAE